MSSVRVGSPLPIIVVNDLFTTIFYCFDEMRSLEGRLFGNGVFRRFQTAARKMHKSPRDGIKTPPQREIDGKSGKSKPADARRRKTLRLHCGEMRQFFSLTAVARAPYNDCEADERGFPGVCVTVLVIKPTFLFWEHPVGRTTPGPHQQRVGEEQPPAPTCESQGIN